MTGKSTALYTQASRRCYLRSSGMTGGTATAGSPSAPYHGHLIVSTQTSHIDLAFNLHNLITARTAESDCYELAKSVLCIKRFSSMQVMISEKY